MKNFLVILPLGSLLDVDRMYIANNTRIKMKDAPPTTPPMMAFFLLEPPASHKPFPSLHHKQIQVKQINLNQ